MHEHSNIIFDTLAITSFIFTMMLLIEYVNVITKGDWQNKISKSKYGQYLIGVFFGIIPGCLGSYTIVSLFAHRVIGFGALVATMIATSGDEAFLMLSLFPEKAFLLFGIIGIIGFFAGIATDYFTNKLKIDFHLLEHKFEVHENESCPCFSFPEIKTQLQNISFPRALLIAIFLIMGGTELHSVIEAMSLGWVSGTMIITNLFGLFVVVTVPNHFLEKHLWEHVLKKHLLKIFFWTFGTLLAIHFMESFIDINSWVETNLWVVLIIAVLIGILPESGPHLIFVTLFASGTIPFSILIANSIVQDGHGTIPLLALSKKSFIYLKIINLAIGFAVGAFSLLFF